MTLIMQALLKAQITPEEFMAIRNAYDEHGAMMKDVNHAISGLDIIKFDNLFLTSAKYIKKAGINPALMFSVFVVAVR